MAHEKTPTRDLEKGPNPIIYATRSQGHRHDPLRAAVEWPHRWGPGNDTSPAAPTTSRWRLFTLYPLPLKELVVSHTLILCSPRATPPLHFVLPQAQPRARNHTRSHTMDDSEWPSVAPAPDTAAGSSVNLDDYGDTLSFLRCFDTMFLVDDSEHIAPFWDDVRALLERIAPVCAKFDPDGIDVFFLNHRPKGLLSSMSFRKSGYRHLGGRAAGADGVASLFEKVKPAGKCNLGARLTKLLSWYAAMLKKDEEGAALNLIVITA